MVPMFLSLFDKKRNLNKLFKYFGMGKGRLHLFFVFVCFNYIYLTNIKGAQRWYFAT